MNKVISLYCARTSANAAALDIALKYPPIQSDQRIGDLPLPRFPEGLPSSIVFCRNDRFVTEKGSALAIDDGTSKWTRKRRRNSIYNNVGSFCCFCRPNYL
ncbi:hypothetical protein PGB90_004670 [Kerria lacca]